MVERLIPGRPGLQAERTALSWTRTALAALVNGALLLLRHDLSAPHPLRLTGACLAFALAAFMFIVSHRRQRDLACRPLPVPLAHPIAILATGVGTATFALVELASILRS
jgi:hypothetical protein